MMMRSERRAAELAARSVETEGIRRRLLGVEAGWLWFSKRNTFL
jgi:hypothetical protein